MTGLIRNDVTGNKGCIITKTTRSLVNIRGAKAVPCAILCKRELTT